MFRTLINVNTDLRDLFREMECYFSITLDTEIVEKIFNEVKDGDDFIVSAKDYLIFQSEKRFLHRQMIITGTVDEHEPADIWIEIKNIKKKDVRHFTDLQLGHVC
jgi:hypothetical protein